MYNSCSAAIQKNKIKLGDYHGFINGKGWTHYLFACTYVLSGDALLATYRLEMQQLLVLTDDAVLATYWLEMQKPLVLMLHSIGYILTGNKADTSAEIEYAFLATY